MKSASGYTLSWHPQSPTVLGRSVKTLVLVSDQDQSKSRHTELVAKKGTYRSSTAAQSRKTKLCIGKRLGQANLPRGLGELLRVKLFGSENDQLELVPDLDEYH